MGNKSNKNKTDDKVDRLMRMIIRPARQQYEEEDYELSMKEGLNYEMTVVPFKNARGEKFTGSHISRKGQEKRKCIVYMHGNGGCKIEGQIMI